jgi:hypothetical protein
LGEILTSQLGEGDTRPAQIVAASDASATARSLTVTARTSDSRTNVADFIVFFPNALAVS